MINIFAQRKTKRESFFDRKGNLIDDGTNNQIFLWKDCPSIAIAKFFSDRIISNVNSKDWKIWME